MSVNSTGIAEYVVDQLSEFGRVEARRMFGGYGIFQRDAMFAIVSKGRVYFKVDDSNRAAYEQAGSRRHAPMPYFEVPTKVMDNTRSLRSWAKKAVEAAHRASMQRSRSNARKK